ncbi:GNAT family N-acetyltransferase [Collinsella sp. An2]|uniref:GNAT family N-acetyltransferase n=1 Tax=Collinsella sp. An2 TaxID=1965585 RepID=UPI0013029FB1|nr:GNAT family N-acetyltransferase [Collinsella sp. An2]
MQRGADDVIHIEKASLKDAETIAELMFIAQEAASCKDFYVVSGLSRVEWKLQNNSFAYLAKDGEKVVGFYIFEMPGLDSNENLGYDIGLGEDELKRVLCMDSVAVLPEYRGLGLQRKMADLGEREGMRRGYDIFVATADPRNTPSVRNFIFGGYDIVLVKESYYSEGVPRALFLKRADGKKIQFPAAGDGVVLG